MSENANNEKKVVYRPALRGFWIHWIVILLVLPASYMMYRYALTQYWLLLIFMTPFIDMLWHHYQDKLVIYNDRMILITGFLTKNVTEVFFNNIKTLKVNQTLLQRILGTGDLMVATSGTDDFEITIKGLLDPNGIRQYITRERD